jgi:hypothetical protein
LKEAIAGLCVLMEGFHRSISRGQKYQRQEVMFLVGNDEDITGDRRWRRAG